MMRWSAMSFMLRLFRLSNEWPTGTIAHRPSLTIVIELSPDGILPAAPIRARSIVPLRTSPTIMSDELSRNIISTPGCDRWNFSKAMNNGVMVQPVTMPMVRWPRSKPATSSTACSTPAAAASACRAGSSAARPAGVSRTTRLERSNSSQFSSFSSCLICALTPD